MGLFSFFKKNKNLDKYEFALSKSRENLVSKLSFLSKYEIINDDYFYDLEEILIESDMSVSIVLEIIEDLKKELKGKKNIEVSKVSEILADKIYRYYNDEKEVSYELNLDNKPSVILVIGVNGVGKTTSIAKLAYKLKSDGNKVLIAAGDTFRSGAVRQIEEWGKRIDVDVFSLKEGSDPSSVYFEAANKAKNENYDILICDSSGRLQNKEHLMRELEKMKKVLSKVIDDEPSEVMLVIDANTGQNGVLQAKVFKETVGIDSIFLAKMDGSSKGGIIFSIKKELNIPVKFIGVGEKVSDIEKFDLEAYVYSLFNKRGEENEKDI